MTEEGYAEDIGFIPNTTLRGKALLNRQEQAVGGIDLYRNADKTEFSFTYNARK